MINDIDQEMFTNKNDKIKFEVFLTDKLYKATIENIDLIAEEIFTSCKYPNQKNMVTNMYINVKTKLLGLNAKCNYKTYEDMLEDEKMLKGTKETKQPRKNNEKPKKVK